MVYGGIAHNVGEIGLNLSNIVKNYPDEIDMGKMHGDSTLFHEMVF